MNATSHPDGEPEYIGDHLRCLPSTTCAYYSHLLREGALERLAGDPREARRLVARARDHRSESVREYIRAHRG